MKRSARVTMGPSIVELNIPNNSVKTACFPSNDWDQRVTPARFQRKSSAMLSTNSLDSPRASSAKMFSMICLLVGAIVISLSVGWEKLEGRAFRRPDGAKMPLIHRKNSSDVQAIRRSDNGCVSESEVQVCVGLNQ